MAEFSSDWSEETYRLDEVEHTFNFPQLIQVTEGIYTPDEVDSFSAGDILKIDQCDTLQKAVTQFADKLIGEADGGREYEVLKRKEDILIPLDYNGKLKVITELKRYSNVRDLATDFPRYADVLQTLSVRTEEGGFLSIAAGTKVELDRVRLAPDRLVMRINHEGRRQVEVPLNKRCRFRSVQDENEYTLKDMVERYALPKMIQFLENRVEQNNTLDPFEDIGQHVNIPVSALRIKRIISQKVLIGHYSEPDTHKRTLLVIPLDSQDIGEIPVKVYEGEEDYPDVGRLLLKNLSSALAKGPYNCSTLTRVSEDAVSTSDKTYKDEETGRPPPVPPRPGQKEKRTSPVPPKPKEREENATVAPPRPNRRKSKHMKARMKDEDLVYEDVEGAPTPPKDEALRASSSIALQQRSPTSSKAPTFPLASIQFEQAPVVPPKPKEIEVNAPVVPPRPNLREREHMKAQITDEVKEDKQKGKFVRDKISGLCKKFEKMVSLTTEAPTRTSLTEAPNEANSSTESDDMTQEEDETSTVYDDIDESLLDYEEPVQLNEIKRPVAQVSPQTKYSVEHYEHSPIEYQTQLIITHQANTMIEVEKDFCSLNKKELQELLIKCGMDTFANVCSSEGLNGAFFHGMDDKGFESLNLSTSDELKLRRIIQGQIPNT